MTRVLYAHQRETIARITGPMRGRALLASDPGMGKTAVTVNALHDLGVINQTLFISPKNVCPAWQKEAKAWVGADITHVPKIRDPLGEGACVMTFAVFRLHATVDKRPWHAVVVDESHAIKNGMSKLCERLLPLLLKTRYVILVSGTPQKSTPAELFTALHVLSLKQFGTFYDFTAKYCNGREGAHGWTYSGASNLDELKTHLDRYMVRVRRATADHILPPRNRHRIWLDLDDAAKATLQTMKIELARKRRLAETGSSWQVTEAQRYFTEYRRMTGQLKVPHGLAWLIAFLKAHPGETVIVLAEHYTVLDAVADGLHDFKIVRADGRIKDVDRQASFEALRRGSVDVGILGLKACSDGITLCPGVLHVIFFERPWTPADVDQGESRAWRIGATETINCHHLVAKNSCDVDNENMLSNKAARNSAVLDNGEVYELEYGEDV